jgi:hypothetical protein
MSNIAAKRWSRRDFVRHAGIASLFAPFVTLFDGRPVAAAGEGKAKYFLLFFTNGTDVASWAPQGSDAGITAFSQMTEPLSAVKDSIIMVDGLSGGGLCSGHGSPGGLCGRSDVWQKGVVSLEQFVSDGLKANGIATQIPHLVLGDGTTEQKTTFYRDGQALTPVSAPATAYNAIFSGKAPAAPPTGGGETTVDPRLARRQSVLDLMNSELTQLKNALGTEERAKLDVHAESLRQIEQRLSAQMGGGDGSVVQTADCTIPSSPANTSKILMDSSLMVQLSINAFACDLTRVSAVQFGHHQKAAVEVPGVTGEWHNEFLHDPNKRAQLTGLEQWLCQEFANAITQLKSLPAPDGDGTLYDQSILLWARDMGDAINHNDSNMVYVFSGGAGGYLKHNANGRYFRASGGHVKALTSAIDAMGITNVTNFGSGDKAPLTQLGA